MSETQRPVINTTFYRYFLAHLNTLITMLIILSYYMFIVSLVTAGAPRRADLSGSGRPART